MIKSPKAKGSRVEREIVAEFTKNGINARRTPMSGALGVANPDWAHDIIIRMGDDNYDAEVKARASGSGFKTLARWKGSADFLILRADREKAIVCMDLDLLIQFLCAIKETRA